MRVAVLGAGANGASIGADLAAANVDVTLVEQWPAHVDAMREHGVRVRMPERSFTQQVDVRHLCEVAEMREPFDVVLMLMKAYDSRWAAQLIEPMLSADGVLVGVQNGMTTDDIAAIVGAHRTLGCVIEISSMMFEPGVVERNSGPDRSWFAVGPTEHTPPRAVSDVAELLGHAGKVEVVDDIHSAKWMKLVSNATTLVTTAILGVPMLTAVGMPGMREVMLRSGQEAFAVGQLHGYQPLPIFGLTDEDLGAPDEVVEMLLDTLLEGFVLPQTKTTVLQDWMKGRRSEVHDINGRVVALSNIHGVSAPVNSAVVEIAGRIERGELRPDPSNLDLLHGAVESLRQQPTP